MNVNCKDNTNSTNAAYVNTAAAQWWMNSMKQGSVQGLIKLCLEPVGDPSATATCGPHSEFL